MVLLQPTTESSGTERKVGPPTTSSQNLIVEGA